MADHQRQGCQSQGESQGAGEARKASGRADQAAHGESEWKEEEQLEQKAQMS